MLWLSLLRAPKVEPGNQCQEIGAKIGKAIYT